MYLETQEFNLKYIYAGGVKVMADSGKCLSFKYLKANGSTVVYVLNVSSKRKHENGCEIQEVPLLYTGYVSQLRHYYRIINAPISKVNESVHFCSL
jgi:hypothetical protein